MNTDIGGEIVVALIYCCQKQANTKENAITEKKMGSWPNLSDGIQQAVLLGFLQIIEGDKTQYYITQIGIEYVTKILELLPEDKENI